MTEQDIVGGSAIVTGAAGGVGRAVVRGLHELGYAVVAVDRAESVGALAKEHPGVIPLQGDVQKPATATEAVRLALGATGRLVLLVNNAAKLLPKSVLDTTPEEWDDLFSINARGPFLFIRAALPALLESAGAIVNVASTSGLVGQGQQAAYAATKGAVIQLTRQVAIDYAAQGVRVNAVAPGAIDTDFAREYEASHADPAALRAQVAALHPNGRFSTAEEVASAVLFLASPGASAITGAVLAVDGGYTAA